MAAMRSAPLLRRTDFVVAAILLAAFGCGAEPREAPAQSEPAARPAPPAQAIPSSPAEAARPAAARRGYTGPLPPLPNVPHQPARPPDVVQAVYAFAARHPEVLQHVPCFCGCERQGHRGNDDCFVAGRDPDGKPRWDMHGYG
jgi:hypothetical protein